MDDIDRAKQRERSDRQAALAAQLERAKETEKPLVIDGQRCCLDCEVPISKERLEARPESVRCIDCKTQKEQRYKRR